MTPTKPLLYSDVVKKNLKLSGVTPIEDIFEAWRDYLQELDNLLSEDLSIPSSPEPVSGHPVEKKSMEFARCQQFKALFSFTGSLSKEARVCALG
jgi:hypothetical protein